MISIIRGVIHTDTKTGEKFVLCSTCNNKRDNLSTSMPGYELYITGWQIRGGFWRCDECAGKAVRK